MFYYQHIPVVEDLVLSKSNLLDDKDDVETADAIFIPRYQRYWPEPDHF